MEESQISDVGEAIPVAAIPVALISWATQTALVSPDNTAGGGGRKKRQWSKHQFYTIFVSVCELGRGEGDQIAVTAECPRGQCGTVSCRRDTSTLPFLLLTPPTTGWRRSWWGAAPAPGPRSQGAPAPLVPTDAFLQAARSFLPMNLHLFSHVEKQCHFVQLLFCHQIPFPQPYLR